VLAKSITLPALHSNLHSADNEFQSFAGDWIDSKGQLVKISPWGVIRYPDNHKLRFEADFVGPNHLQVTFDKDPTKRKFVGKLSHDCNTLVWSNDTQWHRKDTTVRSETPTVSASESRLDSARSSKFKVFKIEDLTLCCFEFSIERKKK